VKPDARRRLDFSDEDLEQQVFRQRTVMNSIKQAFDEHINSDTFVLVELHKLRTNYYEFT
jgi:hypothetical protein